MFHGKRSSPERIVRVLACRAAGLGLRGTARVFESAPNTVLQWVVEAAEPLHAVSAALLHELHRTPVHLAALYAVLSAVREGDMREAAASERLSRSPHGVWTAMAPESPLLLSAQVGERPLAMAQARLPQSAQLVAPGCVPRFLSDGNPPSLPAIVAPGGCWVQPLRRPGKGPTPKPRWRPLPTLLSAQVSNTRRRRRRIDVQHRIVCGSQRAIEQVVAACGWQSNPAGVERRKLRLRQRVAAIGRRRATPGKREDGLRQQLRRFQI
jgi:hypothetical protein